MFEFDVTFPMDSWLDIEVWDYDLMTSDDFIGSTSIDLENRFFSKHRARCGLQQKYEMSVSFHRTYLRSLYLCLADITHSPTVVSK